MLGHPCTHATFLLRKNTTDDNMIFVRDFPSMIAVVSHPYSYCTPPLPLTPPHTTERKSLWRRRERGPSTFLRRRGVPPHIVRRKIRQALY